MERFTFLLRWHVDQTTSVPQQTINGGIRALSQRDQ
jgi:hypothetical protein